MTANKMNPVTSEMASRVLEMQPSYIPATTRFKPEHFINLSRR